MSVQRSHIRDFSIIRQARERNPSLPPLRNVVFDPEDPLWDLPAEPEHDEPNGANEVQQSHVLEHERPTPSPEQEPPAKRRRE